MKNGKWAVWKIDFKAPERPAIERKGVSIGHGIGKMAKSLKNKKTAKIKKQK